MHISILLAFLYFATKLKWIQFVRERLKAEVWVIYQNVNKHITGTNAQLANCSYTVLILSKPMGNRLFITISVHLCRQYQ